MTLTPGKPLPSHALYRRCDPDSLTFETTAELETLNEIPGQARAFEALQFATGIDVDGHNVYVLGHPGTGRHDFVNQFLKQKAPQAATPSEWCYVYNFDDPRKPRALALPPGRSKQLRIDVEHVIQDAQTAIPMAFESEDFQTQREAITAEFKESQEKIFGEVQQEAEKRNIGMIQTPTGVAFIPVRDGEGLAPEEFEKLTKEEQEKIHSDIMDLTRQLQKVMRTTPKRARSMRHKIRQLEHDVADMAVGGLIEELAQKFEDIPVVVEHLKKMQADIVDSVTLFMPSAESQGLPAGMQKIMESRESAAIRRYAINILVDRSDSEGAPVVYENRPSFTDLIGRIEHESEFGSLMTNFTLIRPGSLHRANGGYLVLDAAKVLTYPLAWEGLKRAIKSRELRIRSVADDLGLISTVSLEPEPIPLDVKVILIGDRMIYYLLDRYDPEFAELFKVAADFEDQIGRDETNVNQMARWLSTIIQENKLRHLNRDALARLIEECARRAGDSERLSSDIRFATDLVREAHYNASRNGNELIGAGEIQQAIDSRIRRASRYRDRMMEEMLRETLVVETGGERIGQINGLAVMQLGDFAFARPQRITSTVTLGSGQLVDIEREVELGGPLHSKGVLILSAFLSSHYVTDQPLSLSASLVFEQSYGGVEGDSASAAELCVLASAIARVPIRQSLAVTGSIDQHGRIQAIGGVNEKIEGFFDICNQRGLTGDQGVLIPMANVKHLMLRRDVIEAVEANKFRVFAVDHVDQCLELLTGLPAGEPDPEGEFPVGSMNGKIRERLVQLAVQRREFGNASKDSE
jgi:lon-related putative ATP-dependent protease